MMKTAERRLQSLFSGVTLLESAPTGVSRRDPVSTQDDGIGDSTYSITYVPGIALRVPLVLATESDAQTERRHQRERERLLQHEIATHRIHLRRMRGSNPEQYEALNHVDDISMPLRKKPPEEPLLLGPGAGYIARVKSEQQRIAAIKGRILDLEFHRVSTALKPYLEKRRKAHTPAPVFTTEPTFPASPPMRELKERIVLEPRLKPFIDWVFVLQPSDAVRGKYRQLLTQLRTGGPYLSSKQRKEWRHGLMSAMIHEAWPYLSEQDYSLLMAELRRRNYPTVPAATEAGLAKVLEGPPEKATRRDRSPVRRMFSVSGTESSNEKLPEPVQTSAIRYGIDKQSVRRAWRAFRTRMSAVASNTKDNNIDTHITKSSNIKSNRLLHSDPIYGVAARNRLLQDAARETHRDVVWVHPRFALLYRQFDTEPGERQYAAHDIPILLDAALEVMKNSEDRQFPLRLLLEERRGLYEVVGYALLGGTAGKVARYHVRGHNKRILERAKQVLEGGISWSRRKIPLTRAYWKTDMLELARRWVEDFDLEGLDELSEAVGIGKPRTRPTAEMIFADIVGSRTLPDVAALLQPLTNGEGLRVTRQGGDQYEYPSEEALSLIRHAYRRVRGKPSDAGLTVGEEADVLELATEMVNRPGAFRFAELSPVAAEDNGLTPYAGIRKIRNKLPAELVSSLTDVIASETVPVDQEIMQELLADFFHSPVEGVWHNGFLLGRIRDPQTPAATQRTHLAAMLENFARHEIALGTPLGKALAGIHLPALSRIWADTDFLAAERVIGRPLKTPLF